MNPAECAPVVVGCAEFHEAHRLLRSHLPGVPRGTRHILLPGLAVTLLAACAVALGAERPALRFAAADFTVQLPWFYHGLAFDRFQRHDIYSFEVNGLDSLAGDCVVAVVPSGPPETLALGFDGRTFDRRPVRQGRVELPRAAVGNRKLSFFVRSAIAGAGGPLQAVYLYPTGRTFDQAEREANAFRSYRRDIHSDEREILQPERWDEFFRLLHREGFGKRQLRGMFEEILRWCVRRQVLDPHDSHYGAIYSEEDKYDFRDAAAAAVCFAHAWRDTGKEDYRRRALLARAYVWKGQHREDPANKEQYGGFCQMVGGKWGPPFRRLGNTLPKVTGVETCIIANLLVKTFELGLPPSPADTEHLKAAATWIVNSEFHPGVFHHHEGSTTDCQNSNILAAMALARVAHALERLGQPLPPPWLAAARRGFDHYLEGQEAVGCWPYLFATIGRGQAFREHNIPDQGMGVYHFLTACDTVPFRSSPGAGEALKRAARWWLVMSRIDRRPPFPTIDLDDRESHGDLKFSTFTWSRFMAAASLLQIARQTDEKQPWQQLALRYMEHVQAKLWNRTDPSRAPVVRSSCAEMTLCSWIQAAEWEGALLREMEQGL